MKVGSTLLCGALLSSAVGAPQPLTQLISKLDNLAKAADEEGKTEAVAYSKYQYWCKTSTDTSTVEINDGVATIDTLTDEMEALKREKGTLASQILELNGELTNLDVSKTTADTAQSGTETLNSAKRTELTATIQAMTDCLTKLNDAHASTSAAALLAIAEKHVPDFLGLVERNPPNVLAKGDQKMHVKKWVFKSGGVIELLKQLKLKFEDDLIQLEQEDTNSMNAHALASQERAHALKAAQDALAAKTGRRDDVVLAFDDKSTEKDLAAGELATARTSLKDTTAACNQKEFEWEARSKVRSGEIAALQEASKILAEVSGVRHVAVQAPLAPDAVVASFLQLSSSPSDPRMKAVAFLKQRAKSLHAKALERLAQQLSAHANDPFSEVTNMIEKMIFRLLAEQKNEDEHKQWCDQELKITSASLDDKNARIDVLKAKISADTTAVGKLTNEVKVDSDMVSKIAAFMTSATEIRAIGKKENAISIKDAQDAQTALSNAIAVLTEYYKSTGNIAKEAWEFVQAPPATWSGAYTGGSVNTGTESTTVISLLKTCSEEFAKMEGNTVAQEVQDQESYDSIMQTHKIEKAKKLESIDVKSNEKQRLTGRIESLKSAKKHLTDEHAATEQYQTDLEPACVNGDSTYEDRKGARSKEIQALEDAKDILGKVLTNKNFLQVNVHRQVAE